MTRGGRGRADPPPCRGPSNCRGEGPPRPQRSRPELVVVEKPLILYRLAAFWSVYTQSHPTRPDPCGRRWLIGFYRIPSELSSVTIGVTVMADWSPGCPGSPGVRPTRRTSSRVLRIPSELSSVNRGVYVMADRSCLPPGCRTCWLPSGTWSCRGCSGSWTTSTFWWSTTWGICRRAAHGYNKSIIQIRKQSESWQSATARASLTARGLPS